MNLPEAKKTNLLTTELEDEVVVYDPERKQAHSLNRTALAVWNQCDGQSSLTDLQRRVSADVGTPISEATVLLALRKLERAGLLAEKLGSFEPMSRRRLLGNAGRLGAAAVAAPIVVSALVPVAAAAASCSTLQGARPCGALGVCLCVTPVGETTSQCFTSAGTGTTANPVACVQGVTNCGTGSTCQFDSASNAFWCTCTATSQCAGVNKCIPDTTVKFCHVPCAAAQITCTC
jgi:hypothetical protein